MLNYLFNQIEKSKITLIGYSSNGEAYKDEFISKLPVYKLSNFDIDPFSSIKSFIRDQKIDFVLNVGDLTFDKNAYILIDINDIKKDEVGILSIGRKIKNILTSALQSDLNILITSPTYIGAFDNINFSGGHAPLYMSSLAISIDEKVTIVKNRNDMEGEFDIKLMDLENYTYICNYETSI